MDQGGQGTDSEVPGAPTPEQIVQAQVDAYNRHDVEAFLATYAADVKVYGHPGMLRKTGLEEMRKDYTAMFRKHPEVRAVITNRIVQGQYVIDHEELAGVPETLQGAVVAIYEVRERSIVNVWFLE